MTWGKADNPLFMSKSLVLKNGDTIAVDRLERPFLLTDDLGNPKVFFGACSVVPVNNRKDGVSFNVHVQIN
jgi:hypothetical protein